MLGNVSHNCIDEITFEKKNLINGHEHNIFCRNNFNLFFFLDLQNKENQNR